MWRRDQGALFAILMAWVGLALAYWLDAPADSNAGLFAVWFVSSARTVGRLIGPLRAGPAILFWLTHAIALVLIFVYTDVLPDFPSGPVGITALVLTVALTVAALFSRAKYPLRVLPPSLDEKDLRAVVVPKTAPQTHVILWQNQLAAAIRRLHAAEPSAADAMASAFRAYQSRHGIDTLATSADPESLRNAVDDLLRKTQAACNRVPVTSARHVDAASAVDYARRMADAVLGRPR
ncbi:MULTISPECIES: hypothetical protein [Thermocrispum]|jgi:hypothetical protein|uniref:Uncharacterized protein n=1 Tax=Thermocrispum agreste TaxID=37925 RepID=A0A2W4JCV5_9PSEU|nr:MULTISPECIES: hypothetical protein [Thermocrispum]PZM96964.1 MAG: hypothetical protein DIU77_09945 [Thermocrispum agreste]